MTGSAAASAIVITGASEQDRSASLAPIQNQTKDPGMTSVMLRMRAATNAIHEKFDSQLCIARSDAGQQDYLDFICLMWGWLVPFENLLWNQEWPEDMHAGERNGKVDWLMRDIIACSEQGEVIHPRRSNAVPDMSTLAKRFGVAYVIEGAQMGGQVLRKTLGSRLSPGQFRWLQGYGEQTGARWTAFRKSAEQHLVAEHDMAEAAASACLTFASLEQWFQHAGMLDHTKK
ncbi:MAG: biliverdin-producing heme oxygenase [Janthinobacterium lividum]